VKGHLGETIPSDRTHCAILLPPAGERAVAAVVAAVKALPEGWTARPVFLGVEPTVRHADVILLLDALLRLGAERVRLARPRDRPTAPVLNGRVLGDGDRSVFATLPPGRIGKGSVGFTTPCEWPDVYPDDQGETYRLTPVGMEEAGPGRSK
jgi:hypothetical protein